jgi:ABC-type transport system substrate-binding protein
MVYDTLLTYAPDMSEIRPLIAKSWKISSDGKVYTFTLRDDVVFHDGEMLHADDLVASFHAGIGNSKSGGGGHTTMMTIVGATEYREGNAKSISGIKILDEYTVQVTLEAPSYSFLHFMAHQPIFAEHLIREDLEENPALFFQSEYLQWPIATGPFKLEERVLGDYDVLVAHEEYFRGRPKIDKVIQWDRDYILAAEDNKMDFFYAKDPAIVKELLAMDHIDGYAIENPVYKRELWANLDDPLMQDVRVRKAIAYAIDREAIVEDFFDGFAQAWFTITPPTFWANMDLPMIPYDPAKSKQLLREAGWDSDTELTLIYYYKDPQSVDFMALIQSYLAEVGIKVTPRLLERDVSTILHDKTMPWQLGWGARNTLDDSILQHYSTGHRISTTEYSNPVIDRMLKELEASMDTNERKRIADEIQEIIMEDMPTIPVYASMEYVFTSKRLKQAVKMRYRNNHPFDLELHNWEIVE